MLKKIISLVLLAITLASCSKNNISFQTEVFELSLDSKGMVVAMNDLKNDKNYLAKEQASPLIAIRIDGNYENPSQAQWDESRQELSLSFDQSGSEIIIAASQNVHYLSFEIKEIQSPQYIELVVWGPYANAINKIVGECVGVVRNDDFAIGIRALNPKTMGGYPSTEDDVDPSFDIFASTSLVDIDDSLKVLYRGQAARHTEFGSLLQAYCRDRSKDRIIPMWGHSHFTAPAYDDGGCVGSKIAIFGCPVEQSLDYLEKIVLGENLPYPQIKDQWGKRTPHAAAAYIIYPFNEENIDEAIAFTKKTGLEYLYHGHPFETWGHFKLLPKEFPSGIEGLKKCVDKAALQGIKLGIHTLSNFTTTNDAYVSPIPDKRLAKVGSSLIVKDIDSWQTDIEIEDPTFFNQMENNNLHGLMIGEELVRYESVSESAPWMLINCQRGAWNTIAKAHAKGQEISKLLDHGYNVFLTDISLTLEESRNIANIFNQTGIMQISFDGLEGAWSTGLGQYGLSLMTQEWYDNLEPQYRNCINDASMTTHYNWTIFTRMNWGEPWYAGFRESQMNYRLMNQDFYRRNLMPCMLGWFKYDASTSIEDVEWLLARTAAFDAGYTLVTNSEAVASNGSSDKIIKAIREWEKARLSGAFPAELKKEMEHTKNEYSLEELSENSWSLSPFAITRFRHANVVRQPGEPVESKWEFDNPYQRQAIGFIINANDDISNMALNIGGYSSVEIPIKLQKGESIRYEGGNEILHLDKNWNLIKAVPVDESLLYANKGKIILNFACSFASSELDKMVNAEIKTIGEARVLTSK
ncbi:hypothetical protein AwDysgo_01570 [Bacteroidales bacterium]|nr:hypothetical protein AwDysgo_01570 [Bacteroidales bacterium]